MATKSSNKETQEDKFTNEKFRSIAEEAGDDDLGDVWSMGASITHTRHSEEEKDGEFRSQWRRKGKRGVGKVV